MEELLARLDTMRLDLAALRRQWEADQIAVWRALRDLSSKIVRGHSRFANRVADRIDVRAVDATILTQLEALEGLGEVEACANAADVLRRSSSGERWEPGDDDDGGDGPAGASVRL